MKQESKQRSQEQHQLSHSQRSSTREFASAEELLRHDAAQTQVPPVIAERLRAAQQLVDGSSLELHKLRCEKQGLLDDLLTGRVRVTPLLAEVEREKERA